jgi:hypothetical protein
VTAYNLINHRQHLFNFGLPNCCDTVCAPDSIQLNLIAIGTQNSGDFAQNYIYSANSNNNHAGWRILKIRFSMLLKLSAAWQQFPKISSRKAEIQLDVEGSIDINYFQLPRTYPLIAREENICSTLSFEFINLFSAIFLLFGSL